MRHPEIGIQGVRQSLLIGPDPANPDCVCISGGLPLAFALRLCTLLAALFLVVAPAAARQDDSARDFRFGFSTALMPEVNESDSRVAIRLWADAMFKTGAFRADPEVCLYGDSATMSAALENRMVDGVAMSTTEFIKLRERVEFNHFVFGVVDGSISDEYVLLVRTNSHLATLKDLYGRSLIVQRHSRTCLAVPWLDTLLAEQGLKPTHELFGSVTEELKLTKVVLPVFFGKNDACLVTRKGFDAMAELNPQVQRQLRVLASSPAFVCTGFFFRAGFPEAPQKRCLAEFTRVHETPGGQQILTVFQTERLEEHPAAVLDSALKLMETHRRLCETNTEADRLVRVERNQSEGGVQ
jgi:hypothetical protein